ncbi:MAG: VOC family protein [Leptospira sp.]|nr:VOC family protein [Leptospira sp.]
MIHHIAIGTKNVAELAEFYLKIPNAKKMNETFQEKDGTLRSIWIHFPDWILMLEDGEPQAPRALVFGLIKTDFLIWKAFLKTVAVIEKTNFTYYFSDPEGNKIGISTYPNPIQESI